MLVRLLADPELNPH